MIIRSIDRTSGSTQSKGTILLSDGLASGEYVIDNFIIKNSILNLNDSLTFDVTVPVVQSLTILPGLYNASSIVQILTDFSAASSAGFSIVFLPYLHIFSITAAGGGLTFDLAGTGAIDFEAMSGISNSIIGGSATQTYVVANFTPIPFFSVSIEEFAKRGISNSTQHYAFLISEAVNFKADIRLTDVEVTVPSQTNIIIYELNEPDGTVLRQNEDWVMELRKK